MKRSRTPWLIAGAGLIGLLLLLAGPVTGLVSRGQEPLFAATPDRAELEALGSFADPAAAGESASSPVAASAPAEAAAPGPAATAAGTDGVGSGVSTFSTADLFGLLWRLALVALIVWVSIYALRRLVRRSARVQSASGAVRVLETVGLQSNRLIYLVETGDRVLVVGSTPNHMALLAELSDPQVVAALRADADRTSPRVATLSEMLRERGRMLGHRFGTWRAAPRPRPAGGAPVRPPSPMLQSMRRATAALDASGRRFRADLHGGSVAAGMEAE